MFRSWRFFLVIFLSLITGWFFGFLKFPYIDVDYSFWIGFFGSVALILWICVFYWVGNFSHLKNSVQSIKKNVSESNTQVHWTRIIFLIVLFFLIIFSIYEYNLSISSNRKLAQTQITLDVLRRESSLEDQRNKINLLLGLIQSLDSSTLLQQNKTQFDPMLNRIIALSASFKTEKIWAPEHDSYEDLSTLRGMLLIALANTKMDTFSFHKIIQNVSFAGADLRNVDLHGINLNGIDLKYSNLENANLQGANLNYAELKHANMISINLNQATMIEANIVAASLNWAKINDANLQSANLDSSDLSNATFQKTNLKNATFIKSQIFNAIFMDADLYNAYLLGANLANSNFTRAILVKAHLGNTNLSGTILKDAKILKNSLKQSKENQNAWFDSIQKHYQLLSYSTLPEDSMIYYLKPIVE